jgi:hypothetical protein
MSTLSVDTIQGKTTATKVQMPSGHIIQTTTTSFTSSTITTSTSFTDITGGSLAITPFFSTSKILVQLQYSIGFADSNTRYAYGAIQVLRGSTDITANVPTDGTGSFEFGGNAGGATSCEFFQRYSNVIIDSPSTTSATTYTTKIKAYGAGGGSVYVNPGSVAVGKSHLILMELAQ